MKEVHHEIITLLESLNTFLRRGTAGIIITGVVVITSNNLRSCSPDFEKVKLEEINSLIKKEPLE